MPYVSINKLAAALALAGLLAAGLAHAQAPAAGMAERARVDAPSARAKTKAKARAGRKVQPAQPKPAAANVEADTAGAVALAPAAGANVAPVASPSAPAVAGAQGAFTQLAPKLPASVLQGSAYSARLALPPDALTPQGSLRLQYVLDTAVQAHPSIQAARLDMRASGEDQQAIERQRWPSLSAVMENKSTNTSVSGTRMLRLEQTVWDAGRLNARIREAESTIGLNQARVYINAQTLSLQVLGAWQSLIAADGRIRVARETLVKLLEYRQQMERRVQAEASPPIDLELVLSRMLQTEVELTQAINSRQVALGRMEQYAGLEGLALDGVLAPVPAPAVAEIDAVATQLLQIDWLDVISRHPSVHKARQDALVAQQRIEAKRAEQYPQLYMRLDQPLGGANNNVAGFVGFRYTPGAGLSTGIEAQALATRAASMQQAVDSAAREVKEALFTDRDEFNSSRNRLIALEKAVSGSRVVLESYSRQFNASRKTWLDLMNAVRELAQNQYALVDSQAAMQAALYRLQVRLGEPVQPAP